MSEYQYVGFRAIDRPVSEANLKYMRQQSSRAQVTAWSFENEYHYGDFGGDEIEMLRRGYDLHLHYANFGIRKLLIRFPTGLPNTQACLPYLIGESLDYYQDQPGAGGYLIISPYYDSMYLDELDDIGELLNQLIPLREEILNGDLRPLYLAHLAVASDSNHDPEETYEAPVPAGLKNLTPAQCALAELYGLSDALIAAAAQQSQPIPKDFSSKLAYGDWVRLQPETAKNAWLARLMADSDSSVRAELLDSYRTAQDSPTWPTTPPSRTIEQLLAEESEIVEKAEQKAAAKAIQQRIKRLHSMAEDPEATLREAEQLVAQRGSLSYQKCAELLSDLREALAGSDQSGLAEEHAQKLKADNPTLKQLAGALRRHGFVTKKPSK